MTQTNSIALELLIFILCACLVGYALHILRHPVFNSLAFNAVAIALEVIIYSAIILKSRDIRHLGWASTLIIGGILVSFFAFIVATVFFDSLTLDSLVFSEICLALG